MVLPISTEEGAGRGAGPRPHKAAQAAHGPARPAGTLAAGPELCGLQARPPRETALEGLSPRAGLGAWRDAFSQRGPFSGYKLDPVTPGMKIPIEPDSAPGSSRCVCSGLLPCVSPGRGWQRGPLLGRGSWHWDSWGLGGQGHGAGSWGPSGRGHCFGRDPRCGGECSFSTRGTVLARMHLTPQATWACQQVPQATLLQSAGVERAPPGQACVASTAPPPPAQAGHCRPLSLLLRLTHLTEQQVD